MNFKLRHYLPFRYLDDGQIAAGEPQECRDATKARTVAASSQTKAMSGLSRATDEGSLQIEMRRMLEGGQTNDEVLAALQEWCKSNVEKIVDFGHCPKCTFATGDYLSRFCTHKFCPLRESRNHEQPGIDAEDDCTGHVASALDPKVCDHCGTHIDSLRPDEGDNI